jgi:hypothetical protein
VPAIRAPDVRDQVCPGRGAEGCRSRAAFEGFASHIPDMQPDLSPQDYAAIAELRSTIAADRSPLSARVRGWKAILDKLEPPTPWSALSPLRPASQRSMLLRKM